MHTDHARIPLLCNEDTEDNPCCSLFQANVRNYYLQFEEVKGPGSEMIKPMAAHERPALGMGGMGMQGGMGMGGGGMGGGGMRPMGMGMGGGEL